MELYSVFGDCFRHIRIPACLRVALIQAGLHSSKGQSSACSSRVVSTANEKDSNVDLINIII